MLDSLLLLQSNTDAQTILAKARYELAGKSTAIWTKVYNAQTYLDSQVADLLAAPEWMDEATIDDVERGSC
jgi:hypothetical protein